MYDMCSAGKAKRVINSYIEEIQKQIYYVEKNFKDMDFENADARENMKNIIKEMKTESSKLINELKSYRFQ